MRRFLFFICFLAITSHDYILAQSPFGYLSNSDIRILEIEPDVKKVIVSSYSSERLGTVIIVQELTTGVVTLWRNAHIVSSDTLSMGDFARFIQPDPLSSSYYSQSPFSYCANNPISIIDPNGCTITIYESDSSGVRTPITYSAGMKYTGQDEFARRAIEHLNAIFSNGGKDAMNSLISSTNVFAITNAPGSGNNFQFIETPNGGGTVLAGALMSNSFEQSLGIESLAHELFHAVQSNEGQGGASIFNEVEAYAFGYMISSNYYDNTDIMIQSSFAGNGNGSVAGANYEEAFRDIVTSPVLLKNGIPKAASNFKRGAYVNQSGLYNNFKLQLPNQKRSLLYYYYPNK